MAAKFKREFFKDGEILFGVFYPTRYIIAVFENAAQAEQAVAAVTQAGYGAWHTRPQQAFERAHEYLPAQPGTATMRGTSRISQPTSRPAESGSGGRQIMDAREENSRVLCCCSSAPPWA
jgi:hypothetical protein